MSKPRKSEILTASTLLRLPPHLLVALGKRAEQLNISRNELILRAIDRFLEFDDTTEDTITDTTQNLAIAQQFDQIYERLDKLEKQVFPAKIGKPIRIDWKRFLSEHPHRSIDELCAIAQELYPDRSPKHIRDAIVRAAK